MIPPPEDFRELIRLLNRKRVRYVVIGGLRINFIDLPELLMNKRASGRPKDLEDLRNLPDRRRRRR